MHEGSYREAIRDFVRREAKPPDKFSHQARLYQLARQIAESKEYDEDVVYAAAWLHDLGVFVGHRPEDPAMLAEWDHIGYVIERAPDLLRGFGFPSRKVSAVVEAIRTHMPTGSPTTFEGTLLHDADILEQLGAAGILRIVSKVGRDTRFIRFSDALRVLGQNLEVLAGKLLLDTAKRMAGPRLDVMRQFLEAARTEAGNVEW